MSIFPKRTVRGTTVTIHWNFNTAHLRDVAICPFVRIGVKDPMGRVTMLLEKHMLALPAIQESSDEKAGQPASPPEPGKFLYLRKSTPLLILADYLGGKEKKEELSGILSNLRSGRHYYFTYVVPPNAPLGKYSLISEVHSEGQIRYSRTAADDFFLVESIEVVPLDSAPGACHFQILNHSPEPTPVKLIRYKPGHSLPASAVDAFEMPANGIKLLCVDSPHGFLSYNEERILLPLTNIRLPRCIRSQRWLAWTKQEDPETIHLLDPDSENALTLSPEQAQIWRQCDGIHTRADIRTPANAEQYDEMLAQQLIDEIIMRS